MRYLVKAIYTARYNGKQYFYYYGKDGRSTKNLSESFIDKYSYVSENGAKRNWYYRNPETDDVYYEKSVEIMEVVR